MTEFIGFAGNKQVGKDSAAKFAREILEGPGRLCVKVTAFAEPLKEVVSTLFGIDRKLLFGSNADKNTPTHIKWKTLPEFIQNQFGRWEGNLTIREVTQIFGTDIIRKMFDEDAWVRATLSKDWSNYDVVIISDVRLPNEKKAIEAMGGKVMFLERHTGLFDAHSSENALRKEDFETHFVNDGSFQDLKNAVRKFVL